MNRYASYRLTDKGLRVIARAVCRIDRRDARIDRRARTVQLEGRAPLVEIVVVAGPLLVQVEDDEGPVLDELQRPVRATAEDVHDRALGVAHERIAALQARYGSDRVVSDPMEAAYVAVHLWAQAVEAACTTDSATVRHNIGDQSYLGPGGMVYVDRMLTRTFMSADLYARFWADKDLEQIAATLRI